MTTINRTVETINISNVHFIKDIKENKLYEVTPVNVFIPVDGDVKLIFKNADAEQEYGIHDVKCYESRCDYENGASPKVIERLEMYAIQREEHFVANLNDTGEYELKSVIMKNGVPTEIDAPIIGFLYSIFGAIKQVIWDDDVDVKTMYKSIEAAIMYNNYKYTNENGEETERQGTRSHVLLTDKQKKVFEEFKKSVQKLRDANIRIVFDDENYEAAVVNMESSYVEYDGDTEAGLHPDYLPEEQKFSMDGCISIYYGGNGDFHIYEKEVKVEQ